MDKLFSLQQLITPEANAQAEEIWKLMQDAISQQKTSIIYTSPPNKKMHPLVHHVLTSKGYSVDIETTTNFVYSQTTKYKISS